MLSFPLSVVLLVVLTAFSSLPPRNPVLRDPGNITSSVNTTTARYKRALPLSFVGFSETAERNMVDRSLQLIMGAREELAKPMPDDAQVEMEIWQEDLRVGRKSWGSTQEFRKEMLESLTSRYPIECKGMRYGRLVQGVCMY
jgi:hypothetical protein